jgi:NAD(P)-dependent dehydrogenase (short-subunit alcohol dehydrogenase family)
MEIGMTRLLVIGASGDVGQGVVEKALGKGWSVAAAGRTKEKLHALDSRLGSPKNLHLVPGDIGDQAGAAALLANVTSALGAIDAVVVSVNAPSTLKPLLDWTIPEFTTLLQENLVSHFIAAKTFIPHLADGGSYIAIGGGTADFVIAGMGHMSIIQAAERMMIRALAKEHRGKTTHLRELMIISMVNGASKRQEAAPDWLTDTEIGEHITSIIARPAEYPGPILTLKSKDQVGVRG